MVLAHALCALLGEEQQELVAARVGASHGGTLGRWCELPSITVPVISSGLDLCPAEAALNSHSSYTETVFWREIKPWFCHKNRLFWPADVSARIRVCFWPECAAGTSL